MAFVKLDTGILDSTLWVERESREVFITALLMAEPREFLEPQPEIQTRSTEPTGWTLPAGWYGFIKAAGPGIVNRSGMEMGAGMAALERLSMPDPESRTPQWQGRRMVRVPGGFVILNYMKYRERDTTAAERSKRYRERKAERETGGDYPQASPQNDPQETSRRSVTPDTRANDESVTKTRHVTQEEVEVEEEIHLLREGFDASPVDNFSRQSKTPPPPKPGESAEAYRNRCEHGTPSAEVPQTAAHSLARAQAAIQASREALETRAPIPETLQSRKRKPEPIDWEKDLENEIEAIGDTIGKQGIRDHQSGK